MSTNHSGVSVNPTAVPSADTANFADDDSPAPCEPTPRQNVFETLPASATAFSTSEKTMLHARDIVPSRGLVALVCFSDLMHDDRTLSAYLVALAIRSRQTQIASSVRVLAFGPIKSPGRQQLTEYLFGVVTTMSTFLVDTKTSDLFRILKATDDEQKPGNAVYLVRDGTIVWESIPTRPDQPHDIDGLLAAIVLHRAD